MSPRSSRSAMSCNARTRRRRPDSWRETIRASGLVEGGKSPRFMSHSWRKTVKKCKASMRRRSRPEARTTASRADGRAMATRRSSSIPTATTSKPSISRRETIDGRSRMTCIGAYQVHAAITSPRKPKGITQPAQDVSDWRAARLRLFAAGCKTDVKPPESGQHSESHSSCCLRLRHDMLALLAGAGFLAVEEVLVGFRHRVSAVIADHTPLLVQQCIALGAIPLEAIDLTLAPLTLDN